MRRVVLANDEIYHVFNRSIERRPIFTNKRECQRAFQTFDFYRFGYPPLRLSKALLLNIQLRENFFLELKKGEKQVEIIAYCLMPNHFHLLIRQKSDEGISKFMKLITDSYTRYFNTKHDRVGPVFQGAFKAKHVSDDEQLLHLSRYIHLNPLTSFVVRNEDFLSYPWSSLQDNLKNRKDLVNPDIVLQQFKSPEEYLKFVMDHAEYAKELKRIAHLTFEE